VDKTPQGRLVSLDALRGFVVLVMIFANDLAHVTGLPWWMHHLPPGVSGLTFVDVIYPAFLFMVGTALPLAFDRRHREGVSTDQLVVHVLVRAFVLSVIGLVQMNGRNLDAAASGIPYAVWNAAALTALILAWAHDPRPVSGRAPVWRFVRPIAVVVLIVLVALYRSKYGGWLQPGHRGILGAIGSAYLVSAGLYGWTGGRRLGLGVAFFVLVLWNVGTHLDFSTLPVIGNASAASIVMAGVLAAVVLQAERRAGRRVLVLAVFAAGMAAAAAILAPYFQVSKIASTPSWCLYSAAITTVLLIVFHAAIDVRGWTEWARPLLPAGRNALLVYLLPDIFYALFGVKWLDTWLGHGLLGVARAAALAVAMMAVGALLTRRIRMRV
jgi:heparan-alpha-glucosaminide N-acetyltransferase